jgi:hypothetical protein
LSKVSDPVTDGEALALDVLTEDLTAANRGVDEPEEELDRRALPGSVRAQEPDDRMFRDFHGEMIERQNIPVGFGQILSFDDSFWHDHSV